MGLGLRYECECLKTIFMQVEQIGIFLRVKFGVQCLGIANFRCIEVFYVIVVVSVVCISRM